MKVDIHFPLSFCLTSHMAFYNSHILTYKYNHDNIMVFFFRQWKCDQCDAVLANRWTLKKHMLIHSDEKNWECPTCKKAFRYKAVLEGHMRTHTGTVRHFIIWHNMMCNGTLFISCLSRFPQRGYFPWVYCKTGKFRNRLIPRNREAGNFATGKFRESYRGLS